MHSASADDGRGDAAPDPQQPQTTITTTTTTDSKNNDKPEPIRLTVPPRWYLLPGAAVTLGGLIGFVRGSREAGLRFLAENAHRPPTTVQGWYFYNKTKNYRVLLGGLKRGGRDALALGATAGAWLAIEEGAKRTVGPPWDACAEVAAGLGTAGIFAALCEYMPQNSNDIIIFAVLFRVPSGGLPGPHGRFVRAHHISFPVPCLLHLPSQTRNLILNSYFFFSRATRQITLEDDPANRTSWGRYRRGHECALVGTGTFACDEGEFGGRGGGGGQEKDGGAGGSCRTR
jgi:hypothetical protein